VYNFNNIQRAARSITANNETHLTLPTSVIVDRICLASVEDVQTQQYHIINLKKRHNTTANNIHKEKGNL
jgi:hypothetical protein